MSAAAPPPPPPPHHFKHSTTSSGKKRRRSDDDDEKTPEVSLDAIANEALAELERDARAEEKDRLRKRWDRRWSQLRERLHNARVRACLMRIRADKNESYTEALERAEDAVEVAEAEFTNHKNNEPR